MAENNKTLAFQDDDDEESGITLSDIFGLCISNWYWFVLCLLVTVGCAQFYLHITQPVYTRSTSLIIKESSHDTSIENALGKTMGISESSNTQNEIIALKQPELMRQVVERLSLDYSYSTSNRMRKTELYGSTLPIQVKFNDLGASSVAHLSLVIDQDESCLITCETAENSKSEIRVPFNVPFNSPLGSITISKTSAFKLMPSNHITVSKADQQAVTNQMLGNLSVANTDKSSVICINLNDVNIERADDVLNTLIAVYNDNWIINRNEVIRATNKFITERLGVIEGELGQMETEVANFKVSNKTLDIDSKGAFIEAQITSYDAQNLEFEKEFALADYFSKFVSEVSDCTTTLPIPSGINNSSLSLQVAEYNAMVLQHSNLIGSTNPENPLVTDLEQQMSVLRHGISTTIDNHVLTLKSQTDILRRTASKNNDQIANASNQQQIYIDLERRLRIKEQLYTYLLQAREENELNQAFAAYNTRVLQPSTGSNQQSFPDKKRILLIAFGLGLFLPLGFIVARELLNTKVRGRIDVERLTIPFIGELPELKTLSNPNKRNSIFSSRQKRKRQHYTPNTVVVENGTDLANESFRVLRTNLEFVIGQSQDSKVIMITSANPGSGKTFISYNLAKCMALKQKKVLAIDLDLRRRSLSKYVGRPNKGVSNYLNGTEPDWRPLVVADAECASLSVLSVGVMPPNPAELLAGDNFARLIAEARQSYDYIFIDCPPVEIVADTSIIARHADKTLFVVRVGVMEREFLPAIEELYLEQKLPNMGLILNGSLTATSRYGYSRYGYRYGYGYGYGYGGYEYSE